ncbi:hypothetical protein GAY28_07310 [Azospirillum brasilense]|nr:hypothetical protein [Azospirillum brasilense]
MLGKKELAEALGWNRPKLDRRLEADPNFPILARGTRAGGWQFDLAAVRAYLDGSEAPRRPAAAAAKPKRAYRTAAVADPVPTVLPPVPDQPSGPAKHQGEATAKQRKDTVQSAILEDKLALSRGQLVEAEEMRTVISTMLAHLASGLEGIPVLLIKRLNLSEDSLPELREIVDDLRAQMVQDLRKVLRNGGA